MSAAPPIAPTDSPATPETRAGQWQLAWTRLRGNRAALVAAAYLLLVLGFAFLAPLLSSFRSSAQNLSLGASPPLASLVQRGREGFEEHPDAGYLTLGNLPRDLGERVSLLVLSPQDASHAERSAAEALELVRPFLAALPSHEDPARLAKRLIEQSLPEAEETFETLYLAAMEAAPETRRQLYTAVPAAREALRQGYAVAAAPFQQQLREGQEVSLRLWEDEPALLYHPDPQRHLFGTDEIGRDLLVRVAEGGQVSLAVGALATLVSVLIGVTYGAVSAFAGGRLDNLMMRAVDVLYALPTILLVILLMTLFERSLALVFIVIGAVEWPTMARIVRGQVLGLRQRAFVDAARLLGLPTRTILARHILPNILGPVIVYATLTVPAAILLESVLSFLGLGVQAPYSSWGSLLNDGAEKMDVYPWLLIFPAFFFSTLLLALNFLGDGLRDAFDPRTSAR